MALSVKLMRLRDSKRRRNQNSTTKERNGPKVATGRRNKTRKDKKWKPWAQKNSPSKLQGKPQYHPFLVSPQHSPGTSPGLPSTFITGHIGLSPRSLRGKGNVGMGPTESYLLLTGMNILPNTQSLNSSPQNPDSRSSPIWGEGDTESISDFSFTRFKEHKSCKKQEKKERKEKKKLAFWSPFSSSHHHVGLYM